MFRGKLLFAGALVALPRL